MLVKRIVACKNIFNHFPVIQPVSSKFTQTLAASIFNRLRAIVRYWSEIATFSYSLAFHAPLGCSQFLSEFRGKFIPQKTRIMGLPGSEE